MKRRGRLPFDGEKLSRLQGQDEGHRYRQCSLYHQRRSHNGREYVCGKLGRYFSDIEKYSLHSPNNDGVSTHTQIIIRTPNIYLVLGVCSVSNRELGSKPIDVVEVAIGPDES